MDNFENLNELDEYISLQEASSLLRVSCVTLRNWDKNGTFVAYRNPINNYRLYKISQIIKLINETEDSRKEKRFRLKVVRVK